MRRCLIATAIFLTLNSCSGQQEETIPLQSSITIKIDGIFDESVWKESKTHTLSANNQLYLIQDNEHLYIGVFNNEKVARYVDVYLHNDSIGTLNLHASMQLGERKLADNWNDTIPAWDWGNNVGWSANKVDVVNEDEEISFIESVKQYQGHEFQISKKKLQSKKLMLRFEIKDFVGEAGDIIFPSNSNRMNTEGWLVVFLE